MCTICGRPPERKGYCCEACRIKGREKRRRLKLRICAAYGGRCVCCGETTIEFLSIDHKNNDGGKRRKAGCYPSLGGNSFYRWLLKHGCPQDNYQLMCMNCNSSKGHYGYCPHQLQRT